MTSTSQRRVVITGMAVISPIGSSLESFWNALDSQESGVRALKHASSGDLACAYGGPADFTGSIDDFGELDKERKRAIRKSLKLMCREIQMGVAAAQKALNHSGLITVGYDHERFGVTFGCDHVLTLPEEFSAAVATCRDEADTFRYDQWGDEGLSKITPLWLLKYLPNMPASHIAILNQLRGPNNSLTHREASGNLALGEATETIRRGSADRMLVGATGCYVTPLKSLHIQLQSEMAENSIPPAQMSRPFDTRRTGMVAAEGAAAFIIEELATARQRDAKIWGEILGHGSSVAMTREGIAQNRISVKNSLNAMLNVAGISPRDVGHVHAHGLATRQGDVDEALAIRDIFGDFPVPVVAAKSYMGNPGSGGGLIELVASVLSMSHGQLFPILNCDQLDRDCPINAVREPSAAPGEIVASVSYTPQGQSSGVLVGAWKS